jgi:hypothetical protein
MRVGVMRAGYVGGGVARVLSGSGRDIAASLSGRPGSLQRLAADIEPPASDAGDPAAKAEAVTLITDSGFMPGDLGAMADVAVKRPFGVTAPLIARIGASSTRTRWSTRYATAGRARPRSSGPRHRRRTAAADAHELAPAVRSERARAEMGFWVALFAYVVVMGLGTVPSPLYGLYRERDGFSTFTITLIFGAYSVGTAVSLFLAGHVSDWYGRKVTLVPGIALSVLSAIVFLVWRSLPGLYVGCLLSGLSVGVVSAAATAYETELHLKSRPAASLRRAQVAGTTANLGGLGLGAPGAGLLSQYVSGPLTVVYVVFLVLFGLAIAAGARVGRTGQPGRGRRGTAPGRLPGSVAAGDRRGNRTAAGEHQGHVARVRDRGHGRHRRRRTNAPAGSWPRRAARWPGPCEER